MACKSIIMCLQNFILKKALTVLLLLLVINVICDFTAFSSNAFFTSAKSVDLDNTYLESLLEGLFHKDITMSNSNGSNKQTSSAFVMKLCPVVAFYDQPAVSLIRETAICDRLYTEAHNLFSPQSFVEINSPPPKV
jgi:hypothetical protein